VLVGGATCAALMNTASVTTHRSIVWVIRVDKSDVPDAPLDPDFDKYFTSSRFSRVQQLKEDDAFISDTDNMFFDGIHGIDPRMKSTFDLHVPDSTPTKYDHSSVLDYQGKAISAASIGLLDSNEAWVMLLLCGRRTNGEDSFKVILSFFPLPLSTPICCPKLRSASIASQLAAPSPPPTVDPAAPVSTLNDPDKDVTWQVNHLTREVFRIIWHQRLGHIVSRRVSDMHKYPTCLLPPRSITVRSTSRLRFPKPTSLSLLPSSLLYAIKKSK
jgi:hypothetical protein